MLNKNKNGALGIRQDIANM